MKKLAEKDLVEIHGGKKKGRHFNATKCLLGTVSGIATGVGAGAAGGIGGMIGLGIVGGAGGAVGSCM